MELLNKRLHERLLEKKRKLETHRPLSSEALAKLREQFAIEYTYHTNVIEGNTLTLRETQLVIQEGITVKGKPLRHHLEAINHPKAIEFIEHLAKEASIREQDILYLHGVAMKGIAEAEPGAYRRVQIAITGSRYMPPPPYEVPFLMADYVKWLKNNPEELRPVELAALAHFRLVHIHPFVDGNGRVARLLMNLLLLRYGYPITYVRREERGRYYDALERAHFGNQKPFVNFIGRCVEQSLDLYLAAIEPTTPNTALIPLSEAAKGTPFTVEYWGLLARKGRIDAVKLGGRWHVKRETLHRYLEEVGRSNA
ncbi:MAG: Fic family protein [Candidatus Hadarchaeales archaeon]